MAYATGSAATVDDLLEAIENFAIAAGWTIAKRGLNHLFVEKGICKVAMARHSLTYTDFSSGTGVATNDFTIGAALCTAFNLGLSSFINHTGSIVTSETDVDSVHVNGLLNGTPEYHLFSGGVGDPDYIHLAFRIGVDIWRHFGFGVVDKKGMAHAGAAYITGQAGRFWHDNNPITSGGTYFNQAGRTPYPFLSNSNALNNIFRGAQNLFYVPDALPATADWPVMRSTAHIHNIAGRDKAPISYPNTSSIPQPGFSQPLLGAPPSQWGGEAQLFPAPVFIVAPTPLKSCYVGDYPNVRGLNMDGLLPKAELTLGADTWVVFPISRQTPWFSQTEAAATHTSGHYAIAHKKIV